MTRTAGRRRAAGARLLVAGAALAVGACGWLAAHAVTFWLLAHSHSAHAGEDARVAHTFAAGTVVAGCLAAVAMLSVLVTGAGVDSGDGPSVRRWRRVARRSSALSTAGFLAAEAVEHVVRGEDPPPWLFLTGICLHVLAAAAASLLWLRFADDVRDLLARRDGADVTRLPHRPRIRPAQPPRRRERLWAAAFAGRAPPTPARA